MAKTANQPGKFKSAYPSVFGSHASMIDEDETNKLDDPTLVVLRDEHGLYTTERNKLDNGTADPNRYKVDRLSKLFARKDEAKKD
jgi:hypothetical protein